MSALPSHARVVVIGGGIIGCSTAYHLAKKGIRDVVLIEKGVLTSGSTWHAAGMVGQLRANANITQLLRNSVSLYQTLETETGLSTGWRGNGSLRLCRTKDRQVEFERALTTARSFNLDIAMLGPREIGELCPGMDVGELRCGLFVASDGVANPSDLTMSLARGARQHGCRIFERTAVTAFDVRSGKIAAVETDGGRIACETVVLCAGVWSREIGRLAGVNIPALPSHHQYFVTERLPGLSRTMPSIRDPDAKTYFKEEVGGLVCGIYEENPVAYAGTPSPADADFKLFAEQAAQYEPLLPSMSRLFPALDQVGIKQWFNGLESFTEDTNFIVGEAPEVRNFFVGCGFNSMGIAAGGGAGQALADWIIEGQAPFDMWAVDIRRFARFHRSDSMVRLRALEGQGHHYAMQWPHYEFQTGRPLRRSPLYDRLKMAGACFGSKAGWERPNWFAPMGVEPVDTYSFSRANWFDVVGEEHRACREGVALFDQSSFAKFMVVGRDAETFLQRICAADVGKAPGRVTYTQMLNRSGGIECDLTAARLDANTYYVVTGTAFGLHDLCHMQRHAGEDDVAILDVTSAFGVLGLMGPRARDVLAGVAEADLSSQAFPFGSVREIMVAGAPVRALRISFVGELGWELHVPTEYMVHVFDALALAGQPFGLRHAGYRAIDSLRLEKGYVVWSADVGPDYTPLEAGLEAAVSFRKPSFVGRDALLAQREQPLEKRLVTISVDDTAAILLGRETIYRNGQVVGWLASGGYGYTVAKAIGLGYVRQPGGITPEFLTGGRFELDVAGQRFAARVHLKPLHDPEGLRLRS